MQNSRRGPLGISEKKGPMATALFASPNIQRWLIGLDEFQTFTALDADKS